MGEGADKTHRTSNGSQKRKEPNYQFSFLACGTRVHQPTTCRSADDVCLLSACAGEGAAEGYWADVEKEKLPNAIKRPADRDNHNNKLGSRRRISPKLSNTFRRNSKIFNESKVSPPTLKCSNSYISNKIKNDFHPCIGKKKKGRTL